jgi:hypothetical protein
MALETNVKMLSGEAFRDSLAAPAPPADLDLALTALWWAGKGDWDQAHGCAQQREGDPRCDQVHAYLHRQKGDVANARYWYRRAGQSMPAVSLEEEWEDLAKQLLLPRPATPAPGYAP